MRTQAEYIFDIFIAVSKLQTEEQKVNYLRSVQTPALKAILKFAYDDKYKTNYTSIPKYEPDDSPMGLSVSGLHKEYKRIPYFLSTDQYIKNDAVRNKKLKNIFEIIHWSETEILESIILKKQLPHIDKNLTMKAFPGLLGD